MLDLPNESLVSLKRSLVDRADALGSYIESLQADSGRTDDAYARALEVCAAYTKALVKQVEDDWDEDTQDPDSRRRVLFANVNEFRVREKWIDERFARGRQHDVPRALKTIARDEFDNHQLYDHEPVLTVGAPDNFETWRVDLERYLFHDHIRKWEEPGDAPKLSIFCVPYIEGTRALWYPVVLGHEIAHTRLDQSEHHETLIESLTKAWTAGDTSARQDALSIIAEGLDYDGSSDEKGRSTEQQQQLRELKRQLSKWAVELVCDLNAVRLYGPAGLSAIAEFLAVLSSKEDSGTLDAKTHPPLDARIDVMFQFLKRLGYEGSGVRSYAKVWASGAETGSNRQNALIRYLSDLVTDPGNVASLIQLVERWDEDSMYRAGSNAAVIDEVTKALLDGLPGATDVEVDGQWTPVSIPDVVNAAWAARSVLDDQEAEIKTGHTGALLRNEKLKSREKRTRLDSLASKAIDTLELRRLWTGENQIISPADVECLASHPAIAAEEHGVLSRRTIVERLLPRRCGSREQRLHVLPLFKNSVGDAAIDLRLGPDFIVFRHSATSVFDPIADQDPRQLQERVRKSWGEQFILHPRELVLASTLEYIVLPEDLAAQVITRSSYGRLGLLTATAVQVQPGSRGCITLELVNHGETPIALTPGARVAQLVSWGITDPTEVKPGRYWFPVGPEFSKVQEDRDVEDLERLKNMVAAAPILNEPVVAIPRGRSAHIEPFLEIARKLDGTEIRVPANNERRGLDVGDVVTVTAAINLTLYTLATTIRRWQKGKDGGASVTVDEDGRFVVTDEPDLPAGAIISRKADGIKVDRINLDDAQQQDLVRMLKHLIRLWRSGR